MALNYALDGDILHVTETISGCTNTTVRHWYYDTVKWMVSSHGCAGDTPDRAMTASAIAWVQKHYLPKVKELDCVQ